jgi:hypothetical protein
MKLMPHSSKTALVLCFSSFWSHDHVACSVKAARRWHNCWSWLALMMELETSVSWTLSISLAEEELMADICCHSRWWIVIVDIVLGASSSLFVVSERSFNHWVVFKHAHRNISNFCSRVARFDDIFQHGSLMQQHDELIFLNGCLLLMLPVLYSLCLSSLSLSFYSSLCVCSYILLREVMCVKPWRSSSV